MRQLRSVRIEQEQQKMPVRFPRLGALLLQHDPQSFSAALSDPQGLAEVMDVVTEDFVHSRANGAMVDAALAIVAINALQRGIGQDRPAAFQWRGHDEMLTLQISASPIRRSSPTFGDGVCWTEQADTAMGKVQLTVEGSGLDIIASASGKAQVDAEEILLSEGPAIPPHERQQLCPDEVWLWGMLELVDLEMQGMDSLILSAAAQYLWGRMTMVNMNEANTEHHGVHIDGQACGGVYLQLRRQPLPAGVEGGFSLSI